MKKHIALFGLAFLAAPTYADSFGTEADIHEVIAQLTSVIQSDGVEVAARALADESHPLGGHSVGIMFWVDDQMAMHNKYPDLAGMDFGDLLDLRGNYVIEEFTASANRGGDFSLNYWPHYYDETEYEYRCYSQWVERPRIMITACI